MTSVCAGCDERGEATELHTAGCVHEHFHTQPLCESCLDKARRYAERGKLYCLACKKAGHDMVKMSILT